MAWGKTTATDWMDMLRKMRDYAKGTIDSSSAGGWTGSGTVPSGERWVELANGAGQPGLPGSGHATDGELYLKGSGSDPADEIIVGIKTYRNAGNNIFGWEMKGYTQFDDTLAFTTMPGVSPSANATFDDASMTVWFWVTGRRIMALARVGTNDILIHLGFLQQFGSRGQYPYPLLVAGSQSDQTQNAQANNFGQSCLPDPAATSAYLRWVDGSWQQVRNYTNNSNDRNQAKDTGPGYRCWPLRDPTTNADGDTGTDGNEEALFEQYQASSSLILSSSEISVYPIFPCILMSDTQHIGRVDGLYVAAGLGLVAGDTLTIGSDVYDVYANTYRSEVIDYFAIKRS
jgi:hypothetical protein